MAAPPIDYAVTLFSGFLQDQGDTDNTGFVRLEDDAFLLCSALPNVRVCLYPWRSNVKDIAEKLWRKRPNGGRQQRHLVAGYSYGGQTAVDFAWELNKRNGVVVRELALCDPVRRWKWLPGVAAALGVGVLTVPPCVRNCWWYRQRHPRWKLGRDPFFAPAGHPVVAFDSEKTRLSGPVTARESHTYIDNNASFREAFLEAVRRATVDAERLCEQQS